MPPAAGEASAPFTALHRLYVGAQLLVTGQAVAFHRSLADAFQKAGPGADALRDRYREIFAPAVRRWSILSANYRTIGLFIGAAIGRPDWYFLFEIFGFSAILLLLLAYQRSRYRLLFATTGA